MAGVPMLSRMTKADIYREKAADLAARALNETSILGKEEYERLADGYLRLATQAELNSLADMAAQNAP
jgi:hypothetical protein